MRALIALAGLRPSPTVLTGLETGLKSCDLVLAADGGLDLLLAAGLTPQAYYGDSDSVSTKNLEKAGELGVPRFLSPQEKNFTDGEAAVQAALERGCDRLLIWTSFGATRPDHVLANIMYWADLAKAKKLQVEVTDGRQWLTFVTPDRPFKLAVEELSEQQAAGYFSLIPLLGACSGVNLKGFYYPLKAADIPVGSTRGVSNRLAAKADRLEVSLTDGVLALYLVAED